MLRVPLLAVVAASIALIGAGCGGSQAANVAQGPVAGIPQAASALAAPTGYRVVHVWHADLGPGRASLVVSSVGPRGTNVNGLHGRSMDLRVLSWNRPARRWQLRFDAQNAPTPSNGCAPGSQDAPDCYPSNGSETLGLDGTPATLLDPKADVTLGPVRFVHFAHLLSGRHDQLVFSATDDYGGSGVPTILAVVDFTDGVRAPSLDYTWSGQQLGPWHVTGGALHMQAAYWTWDDPHCCPLRTYHFTVAPRDGAFVETADDRPWLGVTVHAKHVAPAEPLTVVGIAPHSPAQGALRVGDVLVKVLDAPRPAHGRQPSTGSFDGIASYRPGQVVRLLVERGGARIVVRVRLGSMKNAIADALPLDDRLFDL